MNPLHRLLLADVRRLWRQELAICVVLICGIATFVMSTSAIESVAKTQELYYREYHFADLFVQLVRAPHSLASRLHEIPGVDRVQTRVVKSVLLDVPEMVEPVTCHVISLTSDPAATLNGLHLLSGRFPEPAGQPEVVVSELFAAAHHWRPGSKLQAILGGIKQELLIVGIAQSPEYIYSVQPGQLLGDDRRFGILWMPHRQLATAFNMEGAFNDVSLTLRPGSSAADVIYQVDQLLEDYGGRGAYGRDDQMSHRRVFDELHQMRGMAIVTPSIFMVVAVFLFNMVLTRLVYHQQEQIATLRAFGYHRAEIGWYYIQWQLLLIVISATVGCLAGLFLSRWLTNIYTHFFRFPQVHYLFAREHAAWAVLLSLATALAGGYSSVRRAMTLQPAVAMQPAIPKLTGSSWLEQAGLTLLFSPLARLVIRRLERNLRATTLSVMGMACGLATMVLGSFMEDTIDYVVDVQFSQSQRQDVILTFAENLSASAAHDVAHLPGVTAVEPFRSVAVTLRHGHRQRRPGLLALEEQPQLFRVLDENRRPVSMARSGLTISRKLAELLDAREGDLILVELQEGKRTQHMIPVAQIFPDYTDPGAYLQRTALHRLLQEAEQLSGAFVVVDPSQWQNFMRQLKETPAVAGITSKAAALQNFNDTISANLQPMRLINAAFAFIISFGVIYNCALITLAERRRELGTLRVMGFTKWETSWVLLGELVVITLASIPFGLVLGSLFAYFAMQALDTETHRFPLVLTKATLAYATSVTLVSGLVSAWIVRRMLDKLDIISVMKVKE